MSKPSLLETAHEKTLSCVQCGYCLPVCPTYRTTGRETHSPRGRLNLVKMAAEGKLPLAELAEPIDLCLGCRACETACPTGVEYGRIHAAASHALAEVKREPARTRAVRKRLLASLLPFPGRLRRAGHLLWAYQSLGFQSLARRLNLLRLLPGNLGQWEAVLPTVPSPRDRKLPRFLPPRAPKRTGKAPEKRVRVGFLHGCIMEVLFHRVNRLSMELLSHCGYEVVLLQGQTCCGALHAHTGEVEMAVRLAKQNILAAEQGGVDWVVSNAGGCGAHLKEYPLLFAAEPDWEERAKAFAAKVRDISQLLDEAEEQPAAKPMREVITYQPSCHMSHVQKVTEAPRRLLRRIPGITFREMAYAEHCCGSAGVYNLLHFEESMQILDLKMESVRDTKAAIIVTTNPGCQLQLQMGIHRAGLDSSVRVLHLVELLAEAWGIKEA
jgi:glycolate oxidase iron-sulfur subunit